jgi:methionyl-tRNA formyltransferase
MIKIGFFCMGKKGYGVVNDFISLFGRDAISYVVSAKDSNLKEDFYREIQGLCNKWDIPFLNKKKSESEFLSDDYKIAVGWRWMITPFEKLVVLHDSILPKYRGFSPLVNSLIEGESEIGVTALLATESYDEGDVIYQLAIGVSYPIKIKTAIDLICPVYSKVVRKVYEIICSEEIVCTPQDENLASYSVWLDEKDYFIDWSWSSDKIERFVNAVGYPYDNAKTFVGREKVEIIDVELINDVVVENRKRHLGKIIFFKQGKPVVVCGSGLLQINCLNCENRINFKVRFE